MANPNASAGGTPEIVHVEQYSTDRDFIKSAAESSATEVHLGKLAQDRASSEAVKKLGKRMVEASTQAAEELQKAAAALKMQLPADPPRKAKKAEDKLAKLDGSDFDHAYARMAADEEKLMVRQFEHEAMSGMLPGVKEFASKNLPVEQELAKQASDLAGAGPKTTAQK